MRLKYPSQPLVFCFSSVSHVCNVLERLYERYMDMHASLCYSRNLYFLAVYAPLRHRGRVYRIATEFGNFLGPGSVRYSYFEEYGIKISHDAVVELGAVMKNR